MTDLEHVFRYHEPTPLKIDAYKRIRAAAMELVRVIEEEAPASADRSSAVRHVRNAVMEANAALALDGRLEKLT